MLSSAKKILVVDDDRDIRDTVVDALADEGYEVISAADGVDALERLRREATAPSAILLDLMMPRMNGMQFHQEISAVEAWARIPIVVVSADAQGRAHAEAMGAAAYLKKPMKLRELFATVARVVAAA
jgi:two-component system chemotaxis response regulator CheY